MLFINQISAHYMLYSSVKYSFEYITAGQWFSPGTPVSSINKTDCHDITEESEDTKGVIRICISKK
jgi:hypothetical protein